MDNRGGEVRPEARRVIETARASVPATVAATTQLIYHARFIACPSSNDLIGARAGTLPTCSDPLRSNLRWRVTGALYD